MKGTAVAQWLRCCATNRKVVASIFSFKTGLKGDSTARYIYDNNISHSLKDSSRQAVTLCTVCHKETSKEHE